MTTSVEQRGSSPCCYTHLLDPIIADPNGAGKTTFARSFLPAEAQRKGASL